MVSIDGYSLWLGYENAPVYRLDEYRKQIEQVFVLGSSEILNSTAVEFQNAIPAILGLDADKFQILRTIDASMVSRSCRLIAAVFSDLPLGIQQELAAAKSQSLEEQGDSFFIKSVLSDIIITSNTPNGVLYGAFAFLRLLQTAKSISNLCIVEKPKLEYRMLDHWDNLDGSVERGYAGKSIWKWKELPQKVDSRYTDYARVCASVGINKTVLNNVNTQPEIISTEYIKKTAAIANVLRAYGIQVFLSVNFASPITVGNLKTADPFDQSVISWWNEKVREIYDIIPDFGGFLVKADSEGQPGPFAYGRTHAEGANLLASALKPFGGIVVWRAFVYGHGENDRAKKAYANFKPLDGEFLDNAVVQVKNGAIDFQPREPVHPLFGGLTKTNIFMEFQITQEYLGQGNHLVFLAPMWKEILDFDTYAHGKGSTTGSLLNGIAAVANIGSDKNWCGSLFHSANWYAFGRLAWDYTLEPEEIAREWTACTWGLNEALDTAVMNILNNSWNACVDYMTPLCLHHIMKYNHHYGPDPACDEGSREDWKPRYYHRADKIGLGFDRTRNGSDAVDQYCKPVAEMFNSIETCPEKYLLWFHHVPWNYVLSSGRTLKDELVYRYNRGVEEADQLKNWWTSLKDELGKKGGLDKKRYDDVLKKLEIQTKDAREWRDVCVPYFMSFANDFPERQYRNIFLECGFSDAEIQNKVESAWNTIFKDKVQRFYFETENAGYMVDTGNNDVRTEGMSYGMMMSVQMGNKEIFDRLWFWTVKNMYMENGENAGYFAWSCAIDGSKNSNGPAPDGEEYFALALFFASHRWGDGQGVFEYSVWAKKILHSCIHSKNPMWNSENYHIRFVPSCSFTDPSYHLPHFYDLFALWADSEDQKFWKKAAAASRKFLSTTCHPETGLSPEYAYNNGKPNPKGPPDGHGNFYSDSYRVVANVGLDSLWNTSFPESRQIVSRILAFFADKKIDDYMEYNIDGTPTSRKSLHPVGLASTLAEAAIALLPPQVNEKQIDASKKNKGMTVGSPTDIKNAEKAVCDFWNLPMRTGNRRYYDNCLYFFALLALSGNYRIY